MCRIRINSILLTTLLHNIFCIYQVSANQFCYTSGGVFGIIIASVIVTLVIVGLALGILWYLWTKNHLKLDFIFNKNKKTNNESDKANDLESAKNDYAFDNPYFHGDDTTDAIKKDKVQDRKETIILVEGKKINGEKLKTFESRNNQRDSQDNYRNGLNNRFVKSLPLSTVFNHVPILNKKHKQENQKSMDDYFIRAEPERLEVELIGHDFTGLGFNICGNMKDGIFIKDVLSRGPANESGKVKAGDKIVSVNVNLENMVYDDAVAILSYASPYRVKIELEKSAHSATIERLSNNLIINKNIITKPDKQLFHPLYRSHSADDMTRISKELSISEKSTSSAGKSVVQKIKSQIFNRKSNNIKPLVSDENVIIKRSNIEDESIDIEIPKISVNQPVDKEQKFDNICVIETQVENNVKFVTVSDQTANNANKVEEIVDPNISIESKLEIKDEILNSVPENQVKKPVTPAKRKGKAPQPPTGSSTQIFPISSQSSSELELNTETIETKAQVHNEEMPSNDNQHKPNEELQPTLENDVEIIEINGHLSSSSDSLSSEEEENIKDPNIVPSHSPQRVQSPTGKPKSSSMSDLTINADKSQSALLERAVSLDMNAPNLPEENLYQHPKNLLIPEDVNDADSLPIIKWSNINQINTEINSSESTLNDLSQPIVINNEFNNILDGQTIPIDSLHKSDESVDDIENEANITDDTNFISTVNVEPNTSTPVSVMKKKSIDQYIRLDSSSSSSEDESENQTLVGKDEPMLESLSPDLNIENINQTKTSTEQNNREIFELSQSELDGVMMSHKDFLTKKAQTNGSQIKVVQPFNTSLMDSQPESLGFESWHYMSEDENLNKNGSIDDNESTLYTTALDINDSNDSELNFKPKKLPEVSGITLKTGENGQLTNTVIISTNDLSNSSFSSTSSSPPSN